MRKQYGGVGLLLLALLLLALPAQAQQEQTPPRNNEKDKDEPPAEVELADGPWVGELGKCRDLNEVEPALLRVDFKDANGNVRDKRKYFVRWEEVNDSVGNWVVLGIWCPHLKCAVTYVAEQGIYRCPCCNSEFALDGRLLNGRAKKPLTNLNEEVYEEDGYLKLEIEPIEEKP